MTRGRLLSATLAFAALWFAVPSVSRASLIFDFSIAGDSTHPGTVTGEIDLPDNANNNGDTAATHVIVDTASITTPYTLPHDTIPDILVTNHFTVTNGAITFASYDSIAGNNFHLDIDYKGSLNGLGGILNQSGLSGVTFTAETTTVPEPASLAIFGTALAGLGLIPLRRRVASA